jgi:hypothetical protein
LAGLLRDIGFAFFIVILFKQIRIVGCKERPIISE